MLCPALLHLPLRGGHRGLVMQGLALAAIVAFFYHLWHHQKTGHEPCLDLPIHTPFVHWHTNQTVKYRKSYEFCSQRTEARCLHGRPLRVTEEVHQVISALHSSHVDLLDVRQLKDTVFVTGVSASHFKESMDAVASIQNHFPTHWIIFYDWGLIPKQRCHIQDWCGVTLRDLDLEDLQKKEMFYAWKAVTIAHALLDYSGIFWFDSSVRVIGDDLKAAHDMAVMTDGLAFFSSVGFVHSTFAVTHPQTFEYLPSDIEMMKREGHVQSGFILLYKTKHALTNFLVWWLLCSLDMQCISPVSMTQCDFRDGRLRAYAQCHRYDQSIINILAANMYNFNVTSLLVPKSMITIKRKPTKFFNIKIC